MDEKRIDETILRKQRPWVEPAHPKIIKYREDLLAIYQLIKEKYQTKIDAAFDLASKQIGFVVASTLPCKIEVDGGMVKAVSLGAENLKGTVFERELMPVLKGLNGEKLITVVAGTFNVYLLWFSALKLKLSNEWIEPAHQAASLIGQPLQGALSANTIEMIWSAIEPAQFFEGGQIISSEQAVLLSVIDEVYPELRLTQRMTQIGAKYAKVGPGVREPAHFKSSSSEDILQQIQKLLNQRDSIQ